MAHRKDDYPRNIFKGSITPRLDFNPSENPRLAAKPKK
jgi:hypothetical protein